MLSDKNISTHYHINLKSYDNANTINIFLRRYLVDKRVDISAKACTNRNVLHVAAESGNTAVLIHLIKDLQVLDLDIMN